MMAIVNVGVLSVGCSDALESMIELSEAPRGNCTGVDKWSMIGEKATGTLVLSDAEC